MMEFLFGKKKYQIEDVFTPSSSAKLTFVERPELDKQINKALLIPGMQLILYGHSGGGKSTIIQNILKKKDIKFISTNCILDTTIECLILDAFDKLNPYYISETNNSKTNSITSELKSSYLGLSSLIRAQMSEQKSEKHQRILNVQLTPQRLAEFLGYAEVVWIIEDFHKVTNIEREKLSQILKIFVDISNRFSAVKIVAIGAVGTAREVINYNSDLENRVSEIYVPLMTTRELESIIKKGEKLLNVSFDDTIHHGITKFSNSLAAICHHLCFSICFNNNILHSSKLKKVFKDNDLQTAVIDYVKQNSDSFKETLDKAIKKRVSEIGDSKLVIEAFCNLKKEELTIGDIQNYKNLKKIFKGNLKTFLDQLTTAEYGEIIRYDSNSGKYFFSNPFFKAYAIMSFSTEKEHFIFPTKIALNEIKIIMEVLDKNNNVIYRTVKKGNGK